MSWNTHLATTTPWVIFRVTYECILIIQLQLLMVGAEPALITRTSILPTAPSDRKAQGFESCFRTFFGDSESENITLNPKP